VQCAFHDAGHILGSAIIEFTAGGKKLVFSGDLGQPDRPIVDDPARIAHADVLLVESTYGDRSHKSLVQTLDEFAFALTDTLKSRRGNVIIPSFAVGRTQEILYYIAELQKAKRVPPMDVYVDSPMATAATRITLKYSKLPDLRNVRFTESLEESKRINEIRAGAVIISASGMCDGGRIRHHLHYNVSRPECAIVFVGFQAVGTLGRRIVDGAKSVRMFGEVHPVRAKVFTINGLSAHADQGALLGRPRRGVAGADALRPHPRARLARGGAGAGSDHRSRLTPHRQARARHGTHFAGGWYSGTLFFTAGWLRK
jgi:metallo-beta-lactamase family protein